ncbi:helix-turn-helix domain-containing protein [Streptomyces eurocidicus]|uniref:helix-turn-helix domain-containing protein n=1 Tax=Streptomyces eurocidicus TaxID=66423 RepID=UPI000C9C90B4|nr:helix-turn-helix domain-containing protein [Streptomyces eurocidicus]
MPRRHRPQPHSPPDNTPKRSVTGAARKAEAERLAPLYLGGAKIREIAAATGRSYGGTRLLLLLAGVQLRQRGGEPRPEPKLEDGTR